MERGKRRSERRSKCDRLCGARKGLEMGERREKSVTEKRWSRGYRNQRSV